MFKIDDRVFWRSVSDATQTAVGVVSVVAPNTATPYTILTSLGKRVSVTAAGMELTSKYFAKALVLDKGNSQYFHLAKEIAVTAMENRVDILKNCDLVMFTGGEDVTPAYYKEPPHKRSFYNPARDMHEARVWAEAKRLGIPCVGICRGAQFLNVMNGGRMLQHVHNHTSTHKMSTSEGHSFDVSSTHHQMMEPGKGAKLLAWANGLSDVYEGLATFEPVKMNDAVIEPEVLYYPDTRDLCVQYHPEYMPAESEGRQYFHEIMSII